MYDGWILLSMLAVVVVAAEELITDRRVTCGAHSMDVSLTFARPFNGSVFTETGYLQEECRWQGGGRLQLSVHVPLSNASLCGVSIKEEAGEYSVKLLASPISGLLVDGFSAVLVRCVYATQDITLRLPADGPLHISGADVESAVVTGSGGAPALSLQIRDGHGIQGKAVTRAAVGQRITLDATLKDTSIYDFLLHSCHAHDGSNAPDATIPVIDEQGCGVRLSRAIDVPTMVAEPSEPGGAKHAYLYMYGFQFTSSQYVHFECQARPCIHSCATPQCSSATSNSLVPPSRKAKAAKVARRMRRSEEKVEVEMTTTTVSSSAPEQADRLRTLRLRAVIQIEPQQVQQQAETAALLSGVSEDVSSSSSAASSLTPSSSSSSVPCVSAETLLTAGIALAVCSLASVGALLYAVKRVLYDVKKGEKQSLRESQHTENAYSITSIYG